MLAWGTALPQEGTRASQSTHSRAQSEDTPWQTTQDSRDDNSWRARWRPEQRWLCPCISIPGGHSRSTRVPAGSRSSSSRCAASDPAASRSRRRSDARARDGSHPLLDRHQAVHGQLHPDLGPTTLWGYNPAGAGQAPRSTSAASSWRRRERRFRSPSRTSCRRSTSCRSTPALLP